MYTYDRRGRGDGGDTAPYAVEREVEDLQVLVETLAAPRSRSVTRPGAVLALETPGITKLVLYEPPFIVDDSPAAARRLRGASEGPCCNGSPGRGRRVLHDHGRRRTAEAIPSVRVPFWPSLEALAHTLWYDGVIMGDNMVGKPLSADRWSSVTIPTLVIAGGASPPSQLNAVQLADVLPNARLLTMEGQTHEVDPTLLAPVLAEFFPRAESRSGGRTMDLDEVARAMIDGNRYMVLGTADEGGRPWVSPVYYAPSGYSELYWVSSGRRSTRATSPRVAS